MRSSRFRDSTVNLMSSRRDAGRRDCLMHRRGLGPGARPGSGWPGTETPRAARSVALPWRRRALEVRQGRARESRKGHAASCSAVRVRRGLLKGW